ncbi:hypothetical protein SynMITS9220_01554 [Synechococcus sp. MIT S9220]|nr:hypothetical protein SynMITS9220_01554 [Synechococcus sp. MIT S9220]
MDNSLLSPWTDRVSSVSAIDDFAPLFRDLVRWSAPFLARTFSCPGVRCTS